MKEKPAIVTRIPSSGDRLMVAISSRSPNARALLELSADLAKRLGATWFVLHVVQEPDLHYRAYATVHPVPKQDLDYARQLGARVVVERGDVARTLIAFARTMSIRYFITGRSRRERLSFTWSLPLTEQLQRKLPGSIVIIV